MKTKIQHNLNSSAKGTVVSAYMHHSTGYLLLDNNKIYTLETETPVEKEMLSAFIEQLHIGGYIFVYSTCRDQVIRIYDMVGKRVLEADTEDDLGGNPEKFDGILSYKTKEILPDQLEAFLFTVKSETETRAFCWVISPAFQKEVYSKMVKLQVGDRISLMLTPKGIPGWICDGTREFEIKCKN